MISGSISPYSPLQNPASEQSERAIYLSKSVIFIIFRYLLVFLVVGKNDRDLVSNDSFFLIFFMITEINRKLRYSGFTRYFCECFCDASLGRVNFFIF